MWARDAFYPTTQAERQQPADELTAEGLVPTQGTPHFDRAKIDKMAGAMADGSFEWDKASLQPVILGPGREVMGGHHRVVAAHLAGVELTTIPGPRPQVRGLPQNFRPEYQWGDVLPDVQ